jgi:hypothetical protein
MPDPPKQHAEEIPQELALTSPLRPIDDQKAEVILSNSSPKDIQLSNSIVEACSKPSYIATRALQLFE